MWKTSGLFSMKDDKETGEVINDFQESNNCKKENDDSKQSSFFSHEVAKPPPLPRIIEKQQITKPSQLADEEWDISTIDAENDIHCDIFSELSDLLPTDGEELDLEEQMLPSLEPTRHGSIKRRIRKSSSVADSHRAAHFLDHSYPTVSVSHQAMNDVLKDQTATSYSTNEVQSGSVKLSKYMERRKKNNVASRRSREMRKEKYAKIEEQLIQSELKNEELRNRVVKLEQLCWIMKRSLFGKVDHFD